MSDKEFEMAVVLSVYHNVRLCDDEDFRDLLNFMCGQHVMLHDVPIARRHAADAIARRVPGFTSIVGKPQKIEKQSSGKYIRAVMKGLGREKITLRPLAPGTFTARTAEEALDGR